MTRISFRMNKIDSKKIYLSKNTSVINIIILRNWQIIP